MRSMHLASRAAMLVVGFAGLSLGWTTTARAAEPTATVVEYYNAALNHYFITAFPAEIAMLDQGVVVPGWTRTGVSWHAWANAGDSPTAVPVCRFFGSP